MPLVFIDLIRFGPLPRLSVAKPDIAAILLGIPDCDIMIKMLKFVVQVVELLVKHTVSVA